MQKKRIRKSKRLQSKIEEAIEKNPDLKRELESPSVNVISYEET